jgi:hydrogenase maturation protease
MKILVAGVGNMLRADDGFGPRAAAALAADPRLPAAATVIETGIGGIHLAQELMRGYDALILFDACDRGAAPGTLFVLEPEVLAPETMTDRERRDFFADVHYATPLRALALARAVAALPAAVRVIACQIADADAFTDVMDARVKAAVPAAVERALALIAAMTAPTVERPVSAP